MTTTTTGKLNILHLLLRPLHLHSPLPSFSRDSLLVSRSLVNLHTLLCTAAAVVTGKISQHPARSRARIRFIKPLVR